MNWIIFVFSLVFSYLLGFTLNKGLSATNIIKEADEKGKELLKYDTPFIYTVSLNEMFLIISITVFFFLCLHYYYSKSETSICQLFKLLLRTLWVETIIFGFIIGSWGVKIVKNSFCSVYDWTLVFFVLAVGIFLCILQENDTIKNKTKEKIESDLYPSRKVLIPIIDEYLKNIKGISILGEWGIGKSKLLENFFYKELDENGEKYGEKYEVIYIDVASYSDNKKVVDVIQNKLMKILKIKKILKLDTKLIEKVFFESQSFTIALKQFFLSETYLDDSKKILDLKLEEYKLKSKKNIVLCLDNLERLSDPNRIINLLSIVDDLLSDSVKKIYSYDESYMNEIFNKEKIDFKKFMNKYSGVELKLNELEINEIRNVERVLALNDELKSIFIEKINESEKIIKEINDDVINFHSPSQIEKLEAINLKIKELKDGLEKINKQLSNPRYVEYLNSFVCNVGIKYDEKTKFEYRIIVDIFEDYEFKSNLIEKVFIDEKSYEGRKKRLDFELLFNGNYEDTKNEEKIKIEKLKEEAINENNGKKLLKKLDILKKNKREDLVQSVFNEKFNKRINYDVFSFSLLESYMELVLENDINIYYKENMNVVLREDFFSEKDIYSHEEAQNVVRTLLIQHLFLEVKMFVEYIYNSRYEDIKILFNSEIKEFNNKSIEYLDMNLIDLLIELNFKNEELEEKEEIFKYLNKKKLKKELEMLLNFKFTQDIKESREENSEKELIEKIELMFKFDIKNKIPNEKVMIEEKESIHLYIDYDRATIIDKTNVDFYIEVFKKINKEPSNYFIYKFLLLKKRIAEEKVGVEEGVL